MEEIENFYAKQYFDNEYHNSEEHGTTEQDISEIINPYNRYGELADHLDSNPYSQIGDVSLDEAARLEEERKHLIIDTNGQKDSSSP